jgi:hypothetical protein
MTLRRSNRVDPVFSPNLQSICWAAGIYEGEGTCQFSSGLKMSVTQKDRWLVDVLLELFGGTIVEVPSTRGICYRWCMYGSYAAGFLMTVYKFLSPKRQEQIGIALAKWKEA